MSEKESSRISKRGGRRPGAGRPIGSPNKLTRPFKELAALHGEECLSVLVQLRDHAEAEQVRLAAANSLLDRAYGKPRQEVGLSDDGKVTVTINRLTPSTIDAEPILQAALIDKSTESAHEDNNAV